MFTRADKNKDGKLTQEVTYQLNLIKWKYKYKYKQIVNYPFKATQKAKIFKSKQEMCDCVIPMHCYIGPVCCICKANYKPG